MECCAKCQSTVRAVAIRGMMNEHSIMLNIYCKTTRSFDPVGGSWAGSGPGLRCRAGARSEAGPCLGAQARASTPLTPQNRLVPQ